MSIVYFDWFWDWTEQWVVQACQLSFFLFIRRWTRTIGCGNWNPKVSSGQNKLWIDNIII